MASEKVAKNGEIAKKADYRSIIQRTADALVPMMVSQLEGNGVKPDDYQKQCMMNAIAVINEVAMEDKQNPITVNDVDRVTLSEILQQVATLRLNAFSQPRECYFMTRKKKDREGKWLTTVEMGIEGDGNDAILRNFGHGVDEVYPFWAVREDDEFTYPVHRGIDVEPPAWKPCGKGKYVRVVYPIRFKDGTVQYFIGEREDVRVNLVAHISNNLMNETFGIVESRYKATVEQKQQIDAKKSELKALMDGKDIDQILDVPELQPYISPAWREGSRERMILRKMRNNCIKPIPKDFSNSLALSMYNNSMIAEDGAVYSQPLDGEYREIQDPAAYIAAPEESQAVLQQPARQDPQPAATQPTGAVEKENPAPQSNVAPF